MGLVAPVIGQNFLPLIFRKGLLQIANHRYFRAALMDTVTYSPAEFAAIFGKERTWAYRQLYAGKVQAVTGLGRTLIPKSEVDRLLKEAGRYLGAQVKVKKQPLPVVEPKPTKVIQRSNEWAAAVSRRRQKGTYSASAGSASGEGDKLRTAKPAESIKLAATRQAAFQRLTGRKVSETPKPPRGA